MATTVSINGQDYTLPQQGDSSPWGETTSDLLQALVDVAEVVVADGDILSTTFSITNTNAAAANVTGLAFNPATIRGATINYTISRITTTTELTEQGVILLSYNSLASAWSFSQYSNGDAGVTLSITSGGQFQYVIPVASVISGSSYVGKITFSAKATAQ